MEINKYFKLIYKIVKLPLLKITLDNSMEGRRIHSSFNKIHSRYLFIKQKSIGIALIKLKDFNHAEDYIKSVNGKNSAAYFSRKAVKAGYVFKSIDINKLTNEVFEINNSVAFRQGKEMDKSYKNLSIYPVNENNLYFGVYKEDILVSYLWVVKSGELAILNRLLGHHDFLKDGIMYFMILSYIEYELSAKSKTHFVMYDTFFGASDGLKMFKTRCGFKPYRVKWML
jgi:hypothetical protein